MNFLTQDFRKNCINFVEAMSGQNGFYRYSFSGDLYDQRVKWGLGNTIFAVKCLHSLNALTEEKRKAAAGFIKSFQQPNGNFIDPLIRKKGLPRRLIYALRTADFSDVPFSAPNRAETRQAIAALLLLNSKPSYSFHLAPATQAEIGKFVTELRWDNPWGAASHVSHVAFFLKKAAELFPEQSAGNDSLITDLFAEAEKYRQPDGSWHKGGTTPVRYRINAAMKMMTAYTAAKRTFTQPEPLIDLCLGAINDTQACDNLNIICVLHSCAKLTNYRNSEIKDFCVNRLKIYEDYYFERLGGFSFYKQKANSVYYNAKITKGLPEPDIHGTCLFLWGIAMAEQLITGRSELFAVHEA